jgi:hypothetical protein
MKTKGSVYANSASGRLSSADGNQWAGITSQVYSNTTTPTVVDSASGTFKTYTIPANTLRAGTVIDIMASTRLTANTNFSNVGGAISFDGVDIATAGTAVSAPAFGHVAYMVGHVVILSSGSGGTYAYNGRGIAYTTDNFPSSGTGSINTTTTTDISITFSGVGTTGTMQMDVFTVKISDSPNNS